MKLKETILAFLMLTTLNTFAQEIDGTLIPFREGNKWGYSNMDKSIVISPAYDDAHWFSEGFAAVKIGSKYGYINKKGKLVIPAKFTVAKFFRKGYNPNPKNTGGDTVLFAGASLDASNYEICINTKGMRLPKCPAISENTAGSNKIPVEAITKEKKYALSNNSGLFDKIVDDYKIEGNSETYYIAMKNDNYGVFNSKFETIIPFEYNSIKVMKNITPMYLSVVKGGMQGIFNANGSVVISPDYTSITPVNGSTGTTYIIAKQNGRSYLKRINNDLIIPESYQDISYDDEDGFILTNDNNMKGYYAPNNTVIKPMYKDIRLIKGTNFLMVKTAGDKSGYISRTGTEFFVE